MARGCIIPRELKNGKVVYDIKYRNPAGKQIRKKGGNTVREAERTLNKIMREIDAGKYIDEKKITLGELVDKWLEIKKTQVRFNTFGTYKPAAKRLKNFPLECDRDGNPTVLLKDYPLKKVTPELCERYVASLNESELAPASVAKAVMVMNSIFLKALQWEYLARNPAQYIGRINIPQKDMEYLKPDEISRLLDVIPEYYRTLVLTICMTGMRLSEALGLKWADVDFELHRLFVRQVLQSGKFFEPKTHKSRRAITVPDMLIEELQTHQAFQAVYLQENPHDLVFTQFDGKPLDGHKLARKVLRGAFQEAGLPEPARPFHALRHSYVSMLVNQGENIKFIQKQVGHSSARITWDLYSHLYPEAEKDAMRRLQKSFGTHYGTSQ